MRIPKKVLYLAIGGLAALILSLAVGFFFVERVTAAGIPGVRDAGIAYKHAFRMGDRFPGEKEPLCEDPLQALAQALDISVEQLETALEQAREMALQDAVKEGVLSVEQAEQIRNREVERPRAQGPGMGRGAYLAEALGITEAELEQAMDQAHETCIEQALEEGSISEEEAEMIRAGKTLRSYLADAMAEVFEKALGQAVADGAITRAQADRLSEARGEKMRGFIGPGLFGPRFDEDR
jgi:hypothetical protein